MYPIITAVAFIAILGALVLIHELGHFLTARLFKVRVEEFGIGFPPRVYPRPAAVKRRREGGKTVYSLNALPLGGFVRLAGENGVSSEPSQGAESGAALALSGGTAAPVDPGAFATKPAWQRAIILVAGAVNNMVLAMLLVFGTLAVVGTQQQVGVGIAGVAVDSPAERAGFQPGDMIQTIDGQSVRDYQTVRTAVLTAARTGRAVTMTVARGGRVHTLHVVPHSFACDAGPTGIGMAPLVRYVPASIGDAAGSALTLPGNVIQALAALPGQLSGGAPSSSSTQPAGGGTSPSGAGCVLRTRYRTYAGYRNLVELSTVNDPRLGNMALSDTCQGSSSGGGVAGPIGIIREVGCEANAIPTQGWVPLLTLVIELSATLAVINLLPFPALDGGRLLFVLISAVARRRVRPETEALVHAIGMVALLTLVLFISFHDLGNWINHRPAF